MTRAEFLEKCVMVGDVSGYQINCLWNALSEEFKRTDYKIYNLEQEVKLYKEKLEATQVALEAVKPIEAKEEG